MSRKLSASFVHISLGDKNKRVGAEVERGETEIGREREEGKSCKSDSCKRQILEWFSSQENETCTVLKGQKWILAGMSAVRLGFRVFPLFMHRNIYGVEEFIVKFIHRIINDSV